MSSKVASRNLSQSFRADFELPDMNSFFMEYAQIVLLPVYKYTFSILDT